MNKKKKTKLVQFRPGVFAKVGEVFEGRAFDREMGWGYADDLPAERKPRSIHPPATRRGMSLPF